MSVDGIAALFFIVALALFLYFKRRNLERHPLIFPILYVVMMRSKFGLNFMEWSAKKFPRLLRFLGYSGVVICFLGMILTVWKLITITFGLFFAEEAVAAAQPILPFEAKGVFFVPFIYWAISIFVIAVIHEGFHGILSRAHKIRVKSSGFAFLCVLIPVIPAAFVEPDEKQMAKKGAWKQLSVFAAGPFSNLLTALAILGIVALLAPVTNSMIENDGVSVVEIIDEGAAQQAGIQEDELITHIDSVRIINTENVTNFLSQHSPGDVINVQTQTHSYAVTLGGEETATLGVQARPHAISRPGHPVWLPAVIGWIFGLIQWIFMLSIGIGLFNLIPIGPLDGGRMLLLTLQNWLPKKKAFRIFSLTSTFLLALIIINIIAGFIL